MYFQIATQRAAAQETITKTPPLNRIWQYKKEWVKDTQIILDIYIIP